MMVDFLIGAALKEFLRLRRIAIWLLLGLVLYGLGWVYVSVSGETPGDAFNDLSSLLVFRVMMLAAAVYASAVIAQEVEQKTIVYLVTRPVPRRTLVLSRWLASAIVVGFIAAFAAICMSFATYGLQAFSNPYLYRDLKGLLVGSLAYTSLFTFISLLINKAMIVNLLIAFLWETATANITGNIYKLSIFSYLKAIAEKPTSDGGNPVALLSGNRSIEVIAPSTAWVVMALLIGACVWLSMTWFSRFAYLPREDSE
jgi:ABC-2 type transport system permease protein